MARKPNQLNGAPTLDDITTAQKTAAKLLVYCSDNGWAGYDPYDALNSRVFKALPFFDFKMARLLLTQAVKRCPINLRPMLSIPKSPNPKGLALLLSSYVKLLKLKIAQDDEMPRVLAERLLALRSPGERCSCWGYNFDWQTRTYLVPKGSPNIICSTFAANALLDALEQSPSFSWFDVVLSTAEFIQDRLFWRKSDSLACISYTPIEQTEIHNANLLGAAFLCRVGRVSGQKRFFKAALDATRYSVSKQRADGSWPYGEAQHQEWIDNFHTGFNLVALKHIQEYGETAEFDAAITCGLEFYKAHFFREDGAPRYYHNATYPLDIHSAAQSIITLVQFKEFSEGNFELAQLVSKWARANMWDPRGFFHFQKHPHHTVRIPFMRWSQAWMLLALATLLKEEVRSPNASGPVH
jgi:hypothetical protein